MSSEPPTGHIRLSSERAKALGAALKGARVEHGFTQDALALKSGLSPQHLQRIERGTANPTVATLYALADALHIKVGVLLPM